MFDVEVFLFAEPSISGNHEYLFLALCVMGKLALRNSKTVWNFGARIAAECEVNGQSMMSVFCVVWESMWFIYVSGFRRVVFG